MMMMTFN